MSDAQPTWISCRAYAKHRGCTAMAVSLAIKHGRLKAPAVIVVDGQPKIADVALADVQWARNTDPVRVENSLTGREPTTAVPVLVSAPRVVPVPRAWRDGEPVEPPPGDPEGAATATERLKSAQADLAEIKRDEARGLLVLASEVEKKMSDTFSACRTRLLSIPSRARQALPHMPNADVLVLEGLIREALEDLSS